MIAHIQGKLVEKTPTEVVIDCNGVGYLLAWTILILVTGLGHDERDGFGIDLFVVFIPDFGAAAAWSGRDIDLVVKYAHDRSCYLGGNLDGDLLVRSHAISLIKVVPPNGIVLLIEDAAMIIADVLHTGR